MWTALALCGMVVAFLLGGYLVTDEWSREDNETLAELPLERAAEGVKHDRIEFAVYRDLLRSALAEQDSRAAALDSIRDVLRYGGAFAADLTAELKGMAPQVRIMTTTNQAGVSAAEFLDKELKGIGMAVVSRQTLEPRQINGTKVYCSSTDTCKDAKSVVTLLRGRGYDVGDPDASIRAEDNSADAAEIMYNAKVIRLVLLDPKPSQPTVSVSLVPGKKTPSGKTAHRTVKKPIQTANR